MGYWGSEQSKRVRNQERLVGEPGWYPDPDQPGSLRHWHGTGWSESLFDDVSSVAASRSHDARLILDAVDGSVAGAAVASRATQHRSRRGATVGVVAASLVLLAVAGMPRRRVRAAA